MPDQASKLSHDFRSSNRLPPDSVIFGCSDPMQALRRKLDKVAATDVPVLIDGESGSGKEVIARLIHLKSRRASTPFLKVNCPAIPGTLGDSTLVDFEKVLLGAGRPNFGPQHERPGTLFFDEISELDLHLQSKLLQLLQEGQFCRSDVENGDTATVRVISGTSRRLEDAVASGRFRRDLYYRINVASMRIPPLRERSADIPGLVDYFLQVFNDASDGQAQPLSTEMMRLLVGHSWPGNVRELKNLVERYVLFGSEDAICGESHSTESRRTPEVPLHGQISLKKLTKNAVRELERQVIFQVLRANDWNRKRAAQALDISYRALLYKVKQAGLAERTHSDHRIAATFAH